MNQSWSGFKIRIRFGDLGEVSAVQRLTEGTIQRWLTHKATSFFFFKSLWLTSKASLLLDINQWVD